jgi:hypothetical protein
VGKEVAVKTVVAVDVGWSETAVVGAGDAVSVGGGAVKVAEGAAATSLLFGLLVGETAVSPLLPLEANSKTINTILSKPEASKPHRVCLS